VEEDEGSQETVSGICRILSARSLPPFSDKPTKSKFYFAVNCRKEEKNKWVLSLVLNVTLVVWPRSPVVYPRSWSFEPVVVAAAEVARANGTSAGSEARCLQPQCCLVFAAVASVGWWRHRLSWWPTAGRPWWQVAAVAVGYLCSYMRLMRPITSYITKTPERRNWTELNWTRPLVSSVQFSYVVLYAT